MKVFLRNIDKFCKIYRHVRHFHKILLKDIISISVGEMSVALGEVHQTTHISEKNSSSLDSIKLRCCQARSRMCFNCHKSVRIILFGVERINTYY